MLRLVFQRLLRFRLGLDCDERIYRQLEQLDNNGSEWFPNVHGADPLFYVWRRRAIFGLVLPEPGLLNDRCLTLDEMKLVIDSAPEP
ncbi:MAG TPA: hypothetical protein VEI01_10310 [Terriglobales bacterium]|nr:hypothetical protein [Terriglobales bacterium]